MNETNGAPILRLSGIEVVVGGVHALRGVDLDVTQGERLGILGPNGAGKTTLFNVISGDLAPTEGQVLINGQDVSTAPSRVRPGLGVARTYQQTRLFGGLTVADNLFVAAAGQGGGRLRMFSKGSDEEYRQHARQAAADVRLGDEMESVVADLSHGEQRQLEVAMAMVTAPSLLLLDEPASGLSRAERERLTELLMGLDRRITLMLIEHDMDVALEVSERVVVMHEGLTVAEGTPDEIRANQMVHDIYLGRG